MDLRKITAEDLSTLNWIEIPPTELAKMVWTDTDEPTGWWRIEADLSCSACGAYQAVDSDPTNDKQVAIKLAVGLFNTGGWRVDEHGGALCGECAAGIG